jgi:AraC-like DNA-binding protein
MATRASGEGVHGRSGTRPPRLPGFHFETRDPDEMAEGVAPVVGSVSVRASAARRFDSRVRAWRLPRVALFSVRLREGRVLQPDRDYVSLTLPVGGRFRVAGSEQEAGYAPGVAHLIEPGEPFDLQASETRVIVANFELPLVREHLAAPSGRRGASDLRLASDVDTRRGSGATLARTLRWVWRELQQPGSSLHSAQLVAECEDLLAAALVEAAAGSELRAGAGTDETRLGRAEEFLAAHLRRPVSLAEVAEAADLSVRSLSRAFQRRHGEGPIGYLRNRRLEAARRDLQRAQPGEASVTAVALRYGFAHMGRFASRYREAFGETPSQTLRAR